MAAAYLIPAALLWLGFPPSAIYYLPSQPTSVPIFCNHSANCNLTHRPMHSLLHRPLRQMLLCMIHTRAQMLFLDARSARLEAYEVDRGRGHELFGDGDDVRDEAVKQVEGHAFAHHDAENLRGCASGWEGVICRVVVSLLPETGTKMRGGRERQGAVRGAKWSVLGIIIYCFALSKVLTLSCFTWL